MPDLPISGLPSYATPTGNDLLAIVDVINNVTKHIKYSDLVSVDGALIAINNLADVANAATALSNLGGLSSTLSTGKFLLGNASNIATPVNLSQDGSLNNAGALTVTGLNGSALPSLSPGNLKYSGSAWIFDNTTYLTSSSADLRYLELTGGTLTGALVLSGDATAPLNPVSFQQFSNAIQGLQPKPTARARTTAALPTNVYNNGVSGVGATLTGALSGALPAQDGVTLSVGDYLLVFNEAAASTNGLYTVTVAGSVGAAYVLTRSTDMDASSEFNGSFIVVDNEGTTFKNTLWMFNYVSGFTTGTSSVTFTNLNPATSYTNGAGLSLSGTTFSISTGGVTNAMLAGSIAASKLIGTDIATVGTITTGTWNGTAIADTYIASASNWNTAYANRVTSLTTTGSSGAATLGSNVLNIPNYTLAGLGGISLTSLSASSPLIYNNTTGAFSIQVANTSQNGYLNSTDWNTFNSKQSTLTLGNLTEATSSVLTIAGGTAAIIGSGLTIAVKQSSGSQNGYLSSTDWTTFNNKISANQTITLSGDVTGSGTTAITASVTWANGETTYDARYLLLSDNSVQTLTGTQTISSGIGTFYDYTHSMTLGGTSTSGHLFGLSPTLIAGANNNTLTNLYLNATFTNGSFTGVSNWAINVNTGSVKINSGFLQFNTIGTIPATPTTGLIDLYNNTSGNLAWLKSDGFERSFSSTLTASRVYTFQDASYTVAGTNINNSFSVLQTFGSGLTSNTINSSGAGFTITADSNSGTNVSGFISTFKTGLGSGTGASSTFAIFPSIPSSTSGVTAHVYPTNPLVFGAYNSGGTAFNYGLFFATVATSLSNTSPQVSFNPSTTIMNIALTTGGLLISGGAVTITNQNLSVGNGILTTSTQVQSPVFSSHSANAAFKADNNSGSSNLSGFNATLSAGLGTGTGTPSQLIFQGPTVVASGSSAQTLTNIFTADTTNGVKVLLTADATSAGAGSLVTAGGLQVAKRTWAGLDIIVNNSSAGFVQKATSGGHYWRILIDSSGNITTSDLGTSI